MYTWKYMSKAPHIILEEDHTHMSKNDLVALNQEEKMS